MTIITLYFPDISGWQDGIDLYRACIVFIKATEGTYMTSDWYARQKTEANEHGAFVLGYHFLIAGNVEAQAARLHNVIGSTPASLDVESGPGNSRPSLADAVGFIDAYRKLGGTIHWVYFPHWYWQQLGSPSLKPLVDRHMNLKSSAYPSSGYTDSDTGVGWQPYGGMQPKAWQYTDRLLFNGQSIDFSAFRGSYAGKQDPASVAACLAEFKSLTLTGSMPAPVQRSYEGTGDVFFEVDGYVDFDNHDQMWHATIKGVRAPAGPYPSFQNASGKAYFRAPGHFDLDAGGWSGRVYGRKAP